MTATFEELMNRPEIKFIKAHEDALLPQRNNKEYLTGDSGYDVYSVEDKIIPANSSTTVNIGLEIAYIQPGYWIRVESRSGLFFKNKIETFNGIVDNSFRGKLSIAVLNFSKFDYQILKGDRIAQLVVYKLIDANISWTDKKEETARGDKGFGSSGR